MVAVHALQVPEVVKPAATFRQMHEATSMDLSELEDSKKLKLLVFRY
jgi:hypothetical protein